MSDKETLISFGFSDAKVTRALKATKNSGLDKALDWLTNHADDPEPVEGEDDAIDEDDESVVPGGAEAKVRSRRLGAMAEWSLTLAPSPVVEVLAVQQCVLQERDGRRKGLIWTMFLHRDLQEQRARVVSRREYVAPPLAPERGTDLPPPPIARIRPRPV